MRDLVVLILIPVSLAIVCQAAGYAVCSVSKIRYQWGERLIVGYVVCTALFQIIALPFMYFALEFASLYYFSLTAVLICLILCCVIVFRRKEWRKFPQISWNLSGQKKNLCLWGILGIGIVFQIIYVVLKQHTDIDDSFYIAETNTILDTGKVLAADPASGLSEFPFVASYKLVGYEVLLAVIARLFHVNAAYLCHTVLPIFLIALHYIIIVNIARRIHRPQAAYFVLLYQAANLFSGYSGYSQGAFLLYRIWQGKAVMINIAVPILILAFLWMYEREKPDWKMIGFLTAILVTGFHTTTVAVYLVPIAYFGLAAGDLLISRKWMNFVKFCIPVVLILPFVGLKLYTLMSEGGAAGTGEDLSTAAGAGNGAESLSYASEFIEKFLAGNPVWLLAAAAAILVIFLKGSKKEKGVAAAPPVILLLTFCNPLLMQLVAKYVTGSSVYWRVFWLLEIPFLIVAAMGVIVRSISDRQLYGFLTAAGAVVIAVNGAYILNQNGFTDRSNKYKLDSVSVTIADMILESAGSYEDDDGELVLLLPMEISYGIREYTGEISLIVNRYAEGTFTRNGRGDDWEKLNQQLIQPLYGENALEENGTVLESLQYFDIDYVVLIAEAAKSGHMTEGLEHVGDCANYSIYRMEK